MGFDTPGLQLVILVQPPEGGRPGQLRTLLSLPAGPAGVVEVQRAFEAELVRRLPAAWATFQVQSFLGFAGPTLSDPGDATQDRADGSTTRPDSLPVLSRLTGSEREVLTLLARGHSNREIANATFRSESTVRFHVASILAKLGARSRTHAAAIAVWRGLLRSD